MKSKIIEKLKEIIEKKGSVICYLIKIILRNANQITLRNWESNFIHNYAEMYSKLESELATIESTPVQSKFIAKRKEINDLKNELIAWLNDECPAVAPPLEPYTTADLSHNFAELLRIRLDEIIIQRGKLVELTDIESTLAEERELLERVYIKSEKDLPKEDGEYIACINDRIHPVTYFKVIHNQFENYWENVEYYLKPLTPEHTTDKAIKE